MEEVTRLQAVVEPPAASNFVDPVSIEPAVEAQKQLHSSVSEQCTVEVSDSRGADSGPRAPTLGLNPMHILLYLRG